MKKLYILLLCLILPAYTFAIDCPSENFNKFFNSFVQDIKVQKKFTKFPLEQVLIIESKPEPKSITKVVKQDEVIFPIILNPDKKLFSQNILVNISEKGNKAEVKITVENTGILIQYYFIKDKCWELVRIENLSK